MKEWKLLEFALDDDGFWARIEIDGSEIETTFSPDLKAVGLLKASVEIRVGRMLRDLFQDRVELDTEEEPEESG